MLRVQFAHERAWKPRGASNENAVKGSDRSMWNSDTPWVGGQSTSRQRMLERLEVENAQLRGRVVDLVLQIQALCNALGHPQSAIRSKSVGLINSLPAMLCR